MNSPSFFRLILTFSLILFSVIRIKAQYFEKVYGDNVSTIGIHFATTADHGLVIVGNTIDSISLSGYYILKTDSNGSVVWQKNFIDIFNAYSFSITTLKDGKIVLLGTHTGVLFPIVAEVMVLDSNGNFLQSAVFPPFDGWGTAGVALNTSGDSTVSLTLYNDGFISNNYYSIFSLNPDLSIKWSDFVGFEGSFTNAHGLASKPHQFNYTISYYDGYFFIPNPLFRVTDIRKHDDAGVLLLDSIYEFNCITTAVSVTNDGGAVICGIQDTSFNKEIVLIRLDSSGNVLWQKQYGSILSEEASALIQTSDSGFVILSTVADAVIPGQNDLLLMKTNSNGDSLWARTFGGILNEAGLHVEEQHSNLIILGSTNSFNEDLIYLVKTDSTGIIQSPFNIISSGRYFCENDTAILQLDPTPRPDMQIVWSNGDTVNPARVTASGNYYATITDSNGISVRTPFIPVYFTTPPNAYFAPDSISLCLGSDLIDTADSELTNTYQWYFNDTLLPGENSPVIRPQQTGMYKLIVSNNCSSDTSSSLLETLYPLPDKPLINSPSVDFVCPGDSLQLYFNSEAGVTYQWYTTDYILNYIIPGETDTLYYVNEYGVYLTSATNANGCTVYSVPVSVSFDHEQVFVDPSGPAYFCQGGEVELSVPAGTNFLWSRGDTTQTITVDTTGDYFVSFINANGCLKNSDTIAINVFNNPVINIGVDTNLCSGATLTLDAGPGFNNYFWNDGSADQTLVALTVGPFPDTTDYFVSVIDTSGCTGADTLRIVFDVCMGIYGINDEVSILYPNPLFPGNPLHFKGEKNKQLTFIISDVFGRKIIQQRFMGSLTVFDTNMLKPGLYFYYFLDEMRIHSSGKLVISY